MKKKTVLSIIGTVLSVVLAIISIIIFKEDEADIYIGDRKIRVKGDMVGEELYILADSLIEKMGINKENFKIDTNTGEVELFGKAMPYEVKVEDDKVLLPSSFPGDVLGGKTVVIGDEIHVIKPDTVNARLSSGREFLVEYSDDFFIQEATRYNHPLAQSSVSLASAAFSSKEADAFWGDDGKVDRDKNIVELCQKLGFSNIKTYNYDKSLNDKTDKVAFTFAEKNINIDKEDYLLVAVVIRGGVYGNEWVSNFNLGDGETHKGFLASAKEVTTELSEYLDDKPEKTKLWICGFSRGGAVANIVASQIGDRGTIDRKNIYAYTFASPRVTTLNSAKDKKYNYIYNVVSENDLVPLVVPYSWGYQRFGRDVTLPYLSSYSENVAKTQTEKIEEIYQKISNGKRLSLTEIEEENQSKQIKTTVDSLTTAIKDKEKYAKHYEKIIMDFIELKNTKIKNGNNNWVVPSLKDGILIKYKKEGRELLNKVEDADFFENIKKEFGDASENLYYFGAICLKFGKNPYKIINEEIGMSKLIEMAELLSGDAMKMHTPESYIAQIFSINGPECLTIE
ncbi:MAG: lipase family protein [Clostridia bacterium]|nr:lipase family protein [Clostridia bacterium]